MEFQLWSVDTEDDSKGKVEMIDFFNGDEHFTFYDHASAVEFLSTIGGHVQLWATNLGYDLTNIFGNYISLNEITYIGSRVISARLLGSQIHFRDTLNHWKISVKEMGERIGLRKLEENLFEDRKKISKKKLLRRCRRDAEITWHFVKSMSLRYEAIDARLKTTIGSTSLDLFYRKYHARPEDSEVPTMKEMEFILKGYYGGRTEIFFNKPLEGNIQYVDVNSLYPSVMRDFKYPTLRKRRFTKYPRLHDFEGIVDVTIKAPELSIPYLPFRDKKTGRLIFPIGEFRGHYTYFEIRRSIELGYKIKKVHSALEYYGGTYSPFVEFVDELYSARLQAKASGDELLAETLKLNMNNLYGKFGQGNEIQKLVPYNLTELKNGDVLLGDMVLRTKKGSYPRHSNGIWAAYTTAYARDRLYEGLIKIEKEKGLPIYCDTDSAIFESEKEIFKNSKALGEFKLEGVFKYAWFKLPKLYCLIEQDGKRKIRAKGVPRKNQEEFFDHGKVSFQRPYKIREVLRRNLSPKRKVKLVINDWQTHEKTISKTYDKRIVRRDGSTLPICIRGEGKKFRFKNNFVEKDTKSSRKVQRPKGQGRLRPNHTQSSV